MAIKERLIKRILRKIWRVYLKCMGVDQYMGGGKK